jgi:hypothetical protein
VCLPQGVNFRLFSNAKSEISSESPAATTRFPQVLSVGFQWINLPRCDAEYVPDILQKREPYREAHLKLATESCIFAGPKGDPVDGGLLLFATDDESGKYH